jgi:hypothetical protein
MGRPIDSFLSYQNIESRSARWIQLNKQKD